MIRQVDEILQSHNGNGFESWDELRTGGLARDDPHWVMASVPSLVTFQMPQRQTEELIAEVHAIRPQV